MCVITRNNIKLKEDITKPERPVKELFKILIYLRNFLYILNP